MLVLVLGEVGRLVDSSFRVRFNYGLVLVLELWLWSWFGVEVGVQ